MLNPPAPEELERLLRDYERLVSPEDYRKLREKVGLGGLIDGEVVPVRREIERVE